MEKGWPMRADCCAPALLPPSRRDRTRRSASSPPMRDSRKCRRPRWRRWHMTASPARFIRRTRWATETRFLRWPPAASTTATCRALAPWPQRRWPTRSFAPLARPKGFPDFQQQAISNNNGGDMAAKRHRIAVIPGDGIGQEVIPAALTVLEAVAGRSAFTFDLVEFPYGCAYYAKNGRMMAADAFDRLAEFPAIYFGAVGDPSVPDHIAVWELILPLRQRFDQYVNLRPMRLFPGVTSPLANRGAADIDMICVRENSEGEYAGIGGKIHAGTPFEAVEQSGLFTRHGISRIARYAFDLA